MTPAATKEQPPLARLKNLFSRSDQRADGGGVESRGTTARGDRLVPRAHHLCEPHRPQARLTDQMPKRPAPDRGWPTVAAVITSLNDTVKRSSRSPDLSQRGLSGCPEGGSLAQPHV
jgi:hypothetical protein